MAVSAILDLSTDFIALSISLVMVWFKISLSANGLAPVLVIVVYFVGKAIASKVDSK
jgi:hypothetical protein